MQQASVRYSTILLFVGVAVFFLFYWVLALRTSKKNSAEAGTQAAPLLPVFDQDIRRVLLLIGALISILQGFGLISIVAFDKILSYAGIPANIFLVMLCVLAFTTFWIPLFNIISWVTSSSVDRFERYRRGITRQIGFFSGALVYACALLIIDSLFKGTFIEGGVIDNNQGWTFFAAGYCIVWAMEFSGHPKLKT